MSVLFYLRSRTFPILQAPAWLASRIIANTPQITREPESIRSSPDGNGFPVRASRWNSSVRGSIAAGEKGRFRFSVSVFSQSLNATRGGLFWSLSIFNRYILRGAYEKSGLGLLRLSPRFYRPILRRF
jgi:hypothetical protein